MAGHATYPKPSSTFSIYIALIGGEDGSSMWLKENRGDSSPINHGDEFEVTVSGQLTDGTTFSGTDVTRVINPGGAAGGSAGGGTVPVKVYSTAVGGTARISYELPAAGPVSLRMFDAAGRLMRTLEVGYKAAGTHTVTWDRRTDDGSRASSGVYFVRLVHRGRATVKKLLMIE